MEQRRRSGPGEPGVERNKGTSQITEDLGRAGLSGRDGFTWRQEDKRNGPPTALGAQRDDDGFDEHVPEGMALTANGAATEKLTWRIRNGNGATTRSELEEGARSRMESQEACFDGRLRSAT